MIVNTRFCFAFCFIFCFVFLSYFSVLFSGLTYQSFYFALLICVSKDHHLADKEVVTTKEMSKEPLIFFNADSVQNQLLKMRFEMDGYTPNIVMRSSQIYTTLQFVKTKKYACFLYSSMTDKFYSSGITGIPLSPPIHIKIGMVWKKGKYISGDMQTFLNFTRMYYREHPLTQK